MAPTFRLAAACVLLISHIIEVNSCLICPQNCHDSACMLYLDGVATSLDSSSRLILHKFMFGNNVCQGLVGETKCIEKSDSMYTKLEPEAKWNLLQNSCESGPLVSLATGLGTNSRRLTALSDLFPSTSRSLTGLQNLLPWNWNLPWSKKKTAKKEPSDSASPVKDSAPVVKPKVKADGSSECVLCPDEENMSDDFCLLHLDGFVSSLPSTERQVVIQSVLGDDSNCDEAADAAECMELLDTKYVHMSNEDRIKALRQSCGSGVLLDHIASQLGVATEKLSHVAELLPWSKANDMNALTPEELQEANSLASRIEAIEAHTAAAAEAEAQGVQVEEEDYADEEVEDNGASCVLCPDNADPSTCLLYLDGFVASLANTERRTVQETMFGIKCQDTANAEDCAQMLDSHYIRMDTETRLHLLLNSCESGPLLQSVSSRFGTEPMELTSLKNLLPWNWKNPWKKQKKSEPAPAPAEEEEAVVEVTEEPEPLETDEPVVEPTGEALDMPTEVPEATEEVTAPTADIEGESADELIDEIAASSDMDASDLLPSSSADEEDTSSALAPVVAPVAHEADECVLCSRTDPACLLYLYAFVASLSVEAQATIHRTIFNGADTCMEGEDDDDCLYRLDDKFDSLSAEDRLDLLKTSCAAGAMLPYIAGRLGVSPEELAGIKDLLPWNWRPSEADFNPEAVRSEGAIVEKIVAKETAPRSDGTQAPCILCPEGDDSVCLLRLYEFVSSLPYQERQAVHQSIFGEDSCSGAKKELECVKYLDQQFVQMDPRKRLELLTDSCVNGPLYQYITDQIIGLAPGQMLFGLSPMEMWSVQPGFPKPREQLTSLIQVPQLPVDFNLIYSYSFEMPNPEAELLGRTDMGLWDSNLVEGGEGKGEDLTWPWKDVIPPGTVAEDKLAPDLNVLEVEPQVHGLSFSYDGAAMLSYNFLGSDELHTMIKGGNKGGKGKLSYDLSGDSLELDKGKVSYDLSGFLEAQDGAGFDLTEDQMMRLSSQVGRQAGLKPFGSYLRSGLELDEISTAPGLSPLGAAIALIKEGGVSSILVLVGVVVMSLGMVIRSRERRRDGYASL